MIHTLELSREISKDTFEQIISTYNMRWDKSSFTTTMFAERGLPMVRLRKEKKRKEKKTEFDSHGKKYMKIHYMIYLSINPGQMNNGDPHLSTPTLLYSPSFIESMYREIIDIIPCLDECPDVFTAWKKEFDLVQGQDIHYEKMVRLKEVWLEKNAFKAHRIDYCIDIYNFANEYLELIMQGYGVRKRQCMRMNVYHKETEIQERNLPHNPNENYDFLRLEVQADKEKLHNTLYKWEDEKQDGYSDSQQRELQFLITLEIEKYILKEYITEMTGTGIYVSYELAKEIIDSSPYSEQVREKMVAVIDAVNEEHGIANVLGMARKGQTPKLGRESTVKTYLRYIHKLGINPVTLSEKSNAPLRVFRDKDGHVVQKKVLFNLLDIVDVYFRRLEEKRNGNFDLTEADFEAIDKLGPQGE